VPTFFEECIQKWVVCQEAGDRVWHFFQDTDLDFEVSYILLNTTSGLADEILK